MALQALAFLALVSVAAAQTGSNFPDPWNPAIDTPISSPLNVRKPVEQVHVSPSGNLGNSLWLIWTTLRPGPSNVKVTSQSGTKVYTGKQSRYHFLDYTSGFIHKVNLTDLEYGTEYLFRINHLGYVYDGAFSTPPPPGSPLTLTVLADVGTSIFSIQTFSKASQTGGVATLLIGDFSYADCYQPRWDLWERLLSRYLGGKPFYHNYGNHELEQCWVDGSNYAPGFTDFGGVIGFKPADARFDSPRAASSGVYAPGGVQGNLFHSTTFGAAHVLAVNSYYTYSKYSVQWNWIQHDLGSVDRTVTPFVIAMVHAPWYQTYYYHFLEGETLRVIIEPFFRKYGVDVVYHGHTHAYERFTNVYDYREDPCGPVYIVIGNGGNSEGVGNWAGPTFYPNATNSKDPSLFNLVPGTEPAISKFREYTYGHGTLKIMNSTTALWQYYRNVDEGLTVADSAYITSHAATAAQCTSTTVPPSTSAKYILPNADGNAINMWYPIK